MGIWTWISAFLVDHANQYTRLAPYISWLLWVNHKCRRPSKIKDAIPAVATNAKITSQLHKHQPALCCNFLGMKIFLSSECWEQLVKMERSAILQVNKCRLSKKVLRYCHVNNGILHKSPLLVVFVSRRWAPVDYSSLCQPSTLNCYP